MCLTDYTCGMESSRGFPNSLGAGPARRRAHRQSRKLPAFGPTTSAGQLVKVSRVAARRGNVASLESLPLVVEKLFELALCFSGDSTAPRCKCVEGDVKSCKSCQRIAKPGRPTSASTARRLHRWAVSRASAYAGSSEVQFGQRMAASGISVAHIGQFFFVGGASSSTPRMRWTILMSMKITKAMIRKLIMSLMN